MASYTKKSGLCSLTYGTVRCEKKPIPSRPSWVPVRFTFVSSSSESDASITFFYGDMKALLEAFKDVLDVYENMTEEEKQEASQKTLYSVPINDYVVKAKEEERTDVKYRICLEISKYLNNIVIHLRKYWFKEQDLEEDEKPRWIPCRGPFKFSASDDFEKLGEFVNNHAPAKKTN